MGALWRAGVSARCRGLTKSVSIVTMSGERQGRDERRHPIRGRAPRRSRGDAGAARARHRGRAARNLVVRSAHRLVLVLGPVQGAARARRQFHARRSGHAKAHPSGRLGEAGRALLRPLPGRAARDRVSGEAAGRRHALDLRARRRGARRSGPGDRRARHPSRHHRAQASRRRARGDEAPARYGGGRRQARHLDGQSGNRRDLVFGPLASDARPRQGAPARCQDAQGLCPSRRLGSRRRFLPQGLSGRRDRARAPGGLAERRRALGAVDRHRASRLRRQGPYGERHPSRHHRPQARRGRAGAVARRFAPVGKARFARRPARRSQPRAQQPARRDRRPGRDAPGGRRRHRVRGAGAQDRRRGRTLAPESSRPSSPWRGAASPKPPRST